MSPPRKETALRRITALLVALAVAVAGYDVWCLATDRAKEGLYILPFALLAFVAITVKIITHLERCPDCAPDDARR